MDKRRVNLDVIDVKEPCPEPWENMSGEGAARFCGSCRMNVYNLSAMTRLEAEALVEQREGRVCVRFYRRADGTVSTADCAPIRFAKLRKAARRTMTGAAALLVALLGLVTSLGLFRLSGVDVGAWFEDSAIGQLAKAGKDWVDPDVEVMGEMEEFEQGAAVFDEGEGLEHGEFEQGEILLEK